MFAIIVTEKGGEQRRLEFDKSEITIGRVQGNDVILPKGNVSKRHARIVLKDGKFIIVDLKSTNGTYVNGRKITSPLVVKESDKIYIGDFILGVEESGAGAGAGAAPEAAPPPGPPPGPPSPGPAPSPAYPRPTEQTSGPSSRPSVAAPRPPAPPPMPPGPPSAIPAIPEPMSAASTGPSPTTGAANSVPPARPRVPVPGSVPTAVPRATGAEKSAPAVIPPAAPPIDRSVPGGPRGATTVDPQPMGALPPMATPPPAAPMPSHVPATAPRPMPRELSRGVRVEPLGPAVVRRLEAQDAILARLIPRLDLDKLPPARLGDEDLEQKTKSAIVDMVETMASSGDLPSSVDQDALIKDVLNEAIGLGPLEDLVSDGAVEEIIVDRRDRILVRREGKLGGSGRGFSSDEALRRVAERLVAPSGHTLGAGAPLVDVRVRDGYHVTAAVPPVAVRGACLTLRKPRSRAYTMAELLGAGALSQQMAEFLTTCVAARRNLLVCGAPGADRSAVVAALASASPPGERIVSVEDVAELALGRDEWISLEARTGDGNGTPAVGLGALLQSALHMRADRLVVGEVRGAEAFELISAMAASTDGILVASAGDGARAALARLTALAHLGAPGASSEALRHLVSSAVDVVVHVARYADGVVRVASISEV
ncbi:MAG TPA: ATPase, T2SS/T4P/T4SS family, partial [Haliangium sp.]|nr:ATPase, T2SS/T4P/T4SS family [Haliangium sp.]